MLMAEHPPKIAAIAYDNFGFEFITYPFRYVLGS
jgi:hypothetical protein